ncbi:MAG TPA: type IV secretory system conjugative DNA transfer family protein, partial [Flavipsychrobacter sp.]|nr:type IV secretory system conjugative DNA transfer family protein [Flavipsychrobacter sp.]
FPISFNPLKGVHPTYHHLVASGLIGTMKKIWADSWGPRMEHILRFSLLTLLHHPDATLLDIQPLLTDDSFRGHVLSYVKEQSILLFWAGEFDKYNKALKAEVIAPILNKVGLFSASLPLRLTVGQKTRSFRMQEVMDGRKILIANLSKGELGEEVSGLLGCILITSIQMAALYRAKVPEHQRVPFYLYIDEMHSFVTQSFANILAEARKYGLSLFLTHQFIEQLDERIRKAIFGNAGTIISFRVGAADAEYLYKEFKPVFGEEDLVNLSKYSYYIKLMIDGATSRPFSANSLPLPGSPDNRSAEIIAQSRGRYSKPRIEVEARLSHSSLNQILNKTLF